MAGNGAVYLVIYNGWQYKAFFPGMCIGSTDTRKISGTQPNRKTI